MSIKEHSILCSYDCPCEECIREAFERKAVEEGGFVSHKDSSSVTPFERLIAARVEFEQATKAVSDYPFIGIIANPTGVVVNTSRGISVEAARKLAADILRIVGEGDEQ